MPITILNLIDSLINCNDDGGVFVSIKGELYDVDGISPSPAKL